MHSTAHRRTIKMLSFGYLATVYAAIAFAATMIADRFTDPIDVKVADRTPLIVHIFGIVVYLWYLTIAAYFARIIVKRVPFPLDGTNGFEFAKTREFVGFPLFGALLITFSRNLRDRLTYTFWRIGGRRGRLSLSNPSGVN